MIITSESGINQQKILSISIAAYNADKTLKKAIDSIIANEEILGEIEIIIVNDGSTDSTSNIAHEYGQQYPNSIIVVDKENGGYGSTINTSLKIARGKYFKLLDGDDWFNTETLTDYISTLSKVDADLVISPYYEAHGTGLFLKDSHLDIPPNVSSILALNIDNVFFVMHELAIRTNLLQNKDLYITEHCFYTDTEFNMLCFMFSETIARYSRPIYCYQVGINGQSMSLTGIKRHYRDMILVSERIIELYQTQDHINRTKARILENYIEHIVLFSTYGLLVSTSSKKELYRYEKELKEHYPDAYIISSRRKFLRVARLLHYRPFFLMRGYALSQYE